MATTYEKIATVTVGSGGASYIEFTSIPATYTDLSVLVSIRSNRSLDRDDFKLTFNGSGSNYSGREVRGYDSNSTGSTTSNASYFDCARIPAANATANTFGSMSIYIPNYAGSTYKSFSLDSVAENNSSTSWYDDLAAGLWSDISAINTIRLAPAATYALVQYSTATLYGIKNS